MHKYWKGKTTSELATSYMAPETLKAMEHNIFTPGNYFYNGVGHVTVKYEKVLAIGYKGIIAEAQELLDQCNPGDADYATRSRFLQAVIISCEAVIRYARRYAALAMHMAVNETDPVRKSELEQIARNCATVPGKRSQELLGGMSELLVRTAASADRIQRTFHLPGTFRPVYVSLL